MTRTHTPWRENRRVQVSRELIIAKDAEGCMAADDMALSTFVYVRCFSCLRKQKTRTQEKNERLDKKIWRADLEI